MTATVRQVNQGGYAVFSGDTYSVSLHNPTAPPKRDADPAGAVEGEESSAVVVLVAHNRRTFDYAGSNNAFTAMQDSTGTDGVVISAFVSDIVETGAAASWGSQVPGELSWTFALSSTYTGPLWWVALEITGLNYLYQGATMPIGQFVPKGVAATGAPGSTTAGVPSSGMSDADWVGAGYDQFGWLELTAAATTTTDPGLQTWSSDDAGILAASGQPADGRVSMAVWVNVVQGWPRPQTGRTAFVQGPLASLWSGSLWLALPYVPPIETPPETVPAPTYTNVPAPDPADWTFATGTTPLGDVLRLEVHDGTTMVDRLGTCTQIKTHRSPLGLGTLTATFKGTTFDPAKSTVLKAGRKVRLTTRTRVSGGGAWDTLFTGTVKQARLESGNVRLDVVDTVARLAAVGHKDLVAHVNQLSGALGAAGVSYDVGGSVSASVVGKNTKGSVLDTVLIARDSCHGWAWVSRDGKVTARTALSTGVRAVLDEDDYSQVTVGWSTDQLINDVRVKWLRYLPGSGATEPIEYGPYRDQSSVDAWGQAPATYLIGGPEEDPNVIGDYAAAVLAANKTPRSIVQSLRMPVKRSGDVAPGKALVDLYDLVQVSNAEKGLVKVPHRVVAVAHTITPHSWIVDVDLDADGFLPVPYKATEPDGDTHSHFLDDLYDVNAPVPTGGQVLTYDGPSGTWIAAAGGGGGSTGGDTAWLNLPTGGSWVAYGAGYAPPGAWKDADGFVHLRGLIKGGALGGTAVYLSDVPEYDETFLVASNAGAAQVTVSAGNYIVTVDRYVSSGSNAAVSLSGITYKSAY